MAEDDPLSKTSPSGQPRSQGVEQGQTLAGRYRLVRFIASGGMGEVWEAEDLRLHEQVALKTVRPDLVDPEHLLRLESEVKLARRIGHRNVCRVFELGEHLSHDGAGAARVSFITMELLRGRPLNEVVRSRGRLPWAEALVLIEQLASALDAAHAVGVVHRDFKTPNVFVEDDHGAARVVVTDFGIARSLNGASRVTLNPGAMMGTPAYMAPEQVEGRDAGPAADTFALGVVAFELVTGQLPFRGESALAIAMARLQQSPIRVTSVEPSVPASWDDALARAMARNPEDRFGTAAEFAGALKRPSASAALPQTRKRMMVAATLAFVAALIALGTTRRGGPPTPTAPVGVPSASAPDAGALNDVEAFASGTEVPQARTAFLAALRSARLGDTFGATRDFARAAELDESYGAAHLWWAVWLAPYDLTTARRSFGKAQRATGTMSAINEELLAAEGPCIQLEPPNGRDCSIRLEQFIQRWPASAWPHFLLAEVREATDPSGAIQEFRAVRRIDPGFVAALAREGSIEVTLGHFDAALALLNRCVELQPTASDCFYSRATVHLQRGDCTSLAADAIRWRAAQPDSNWPLYYLAASSIARDAPTEEVQELITQQLARTRGDDRLYAEKLIALHRVLTGDLTAIRAWVSNARGLLEKSSDREAHFLFQKTQIDLAIETGQLAEAARLANDTLLRKDSWQANARRDDWEMEKDRTPFFEDVLVRNGALAAPTRERRRQAWMADWRVKVPQSSSAGTPWLLGYAALVRDAEGAREAIAAMPDGGVPVVYPDIYPDEGIGRMFLLSGRVTEAMPYLRRAAHGCSPLRDVFGYVRSRVTLGDALAETGDTAAACAEYRDVIERWGAMKPRSVTAELARTRAAALKCVP